MTDNPLHTVHVNIGSNLGNRHDNITKALRCLEIISAGSFNCSPPFYSRPWQFDSENMFVNVGVTFTTRLSPAELLEKCRETELSISDLPHRNAAGEYVDRIIDIDIIAYDNLITKDENLIIPHPRMHLREFVLRPLSQTWPDWTHPIMHKTAVELMANLSE